MKRLLSIGFASLCAVAFAPTGCSDPVNPPPRVVMESTVVQGAHGKQCQISSVQWVNIGGFGNPAAGTPPRPVEDGTTDNGAAVHVSCSVKKNGSAYDVLAEAQISGPDGGTITIVGSFTEQGNQANLRGVFQRGDFGKYEQKDCTADYSPSTVAGVAPGRVWALMKCPNLARPDIDALCEGQVQFRFENCQQ
jgi:hypothetical protein